MGGDPRRSSRAGPAIRASQRLCGKTRRMPDAALRRRTDRAGPVRPGRRGQQIPRPVQARRCCPACCRRASIASPMRRTTRASRRSPSRSAAIASAATARRTRPTSGWCRPTASMSPTITRMAEAATLARDLINTPSNDMGPEELAQAARAACKALRRQFQLHRRRRSDATELSADSCGRHGVAARAAPDRFELGRSCPSQGDAGRQGRLLRHRRARSEAVQRHADHEEGHGRRRQCAGAGADGDGRQAEGAACGC